MIAMPVKMNKENSAISPVFGKVKYFAIVSDNGEIQFIENIEKSGTKAVELLLSKGVKTLLMAHIGESPFKFALTKGIKIFFVGKERITINEAVQKFKNNQLIDATTIDLSQFSTHGKHDHQHEHNHEHHHHH
jgi:predicted Fe-Mo cluster-binding NifX family protein